MNHGWYVILTFIHVVCAVFWIGSMLFMSLVVVPSAREQADPSIIARTIRMVGRRYRRWGWIALGTLAVTGVLILRAKGFLWETLITASFWQAGYGRTLAEKLALFALVVLLSFLHDTAIGVAPRRAGASTDTPAARATRHRLASWMGRLVLLLSLAILLLALTLVRGSPW